MELGLSLVRDAGTVVAFGAAMSGSIIKLDPNRIHYLKVNFTGSFNCTTAEFRQAVEWIRELPVSSLITHRFPSDEILEGYRAMARYGPQRDPQTHTADVGF